MSDSPDAQLQLKKRARRRLVGAVAFAGLAAIILPMVMDEEPKQQVQDVQIRIPGQDQAPFAPNLKPATAEKKDDGALAQSAPAAPSSAPPAKPVEKPVEKPVKAVASDDQRAAAILGDKPDAKSVSATAKGGGQHVILIGAFSNPANVKQLQSKLGELGIKVYTEPLDSPEGKKTRVRAGPFPSRDAADKALDKMKRIGINGVVAAKQ